MAKRTKTIYTCDLHEGEVEGNDTITFSLEGKSYELEACDEHAAKMRDDFAPYVGAARPAGRGSGSTPRRSRESSSGRSSSGASSSGGDRERVQAVREWARANGHQVSERGRLSAAVLKAYDEAH